MRASASTFAIEMRGGEAADSRTNDHEVYRLIDGQSVDGELPAIAHLVGDEE